MHPCPPRTQASGWPFLALLFVDSGSPLREPADDPATFPLSDIKPGMKGVVYTIFEGDQVEKVDLEVIGILNDALGPKQDVILVKLLGDKADKTGRRGGHERQPGLFRWQARGRAFAENRQFHQGRDRRRNADRRACSMWRSRRTVPAMPVKLQRLNASDGGDFAQAICAVGAGTGQFLIPIETPLISAGLYPANAGAIQAVNWRSCGISRDGRRQCAARRRRTRKSSPATWSEWIWCAAIFR